MRGWAPAKGWPDGTIWQLFVMSLANHRCKKKEMQAAVKEVCDADKHSPDRNREVPGNGDRAALHRRCLEWLTVPRPSVLEVQDPADGTLLAEVAAGLSADC